MNLQQKTFSCTTKQVDANRGEVVFYAAIFNERDSDNDIILPGAFRKTIEQNGPGGANRLKHLWQHQVTAMIGKVLEAQEDGTGLLIRSKLVNTTLGRDALALYEAGVIQEHSIGFQAKGRYSAAHDATVYDEIQTLWEASSVTWGANASARTVSVKALQHGNTATIANRIKALQNAINNYQLSEATLSALLAGVVTMKAQVSDTGADDYTAEIRRFEQRMNRHISRIYL